MTVFFFFTVSLKGSISPFKKARPRLFCSYSAADVVKHSAADVVKHSAAANVRHSTADVVKHSAAANVRHSTAVECQAVLPFFTRDQIYPPIPIAANSHTPRTSVMKYFRNSASRSSSGITDMLSKIVNP